MYDHVDDKITRDVLNQVNTDALNITLSLDFAMQCLQADQHNEDVSYEVYGMRAEHLLDAFDCWLVDNDVEQTVIALRLFWGV